MKQQLFLHELSIGERAAVSALFSEPAMRRRLQDIGLIENTTVECIGKSPLGDPAAYWIRGAVIAIRREDAKKIAVCRKAESE